jgi:hypothetical protein
MYGQDTNKKDVKGIVSFSNEYPIIASSGLAQEPTTVSVEAHKICEITFCLLASSIVVVKFAFFSAFLINVQTQQFIALISCSFSIT